MSSLYRACIEAMLADLSKAPSLELVPEQICMDMIARIVQKGELNLRSVAFFRTSSSLRVHAFLDSLDVFSVIPESPSGQCSCQTCCWCLCELNRVAWFSSLQDTMALNNSEYFECAPPDLVCYAGLPLFSWTSLFCTSMDFIFC